MSTSDIHELCSKHENITLVAVHMEAWNHCRLSRNDLKAYIKTNNIKTNILIPNDGDILGF